MCHIVEAAKRKGVVSVRETEGQKPKGALTKARIGVILPNHRSEAGDEKTGFAS